jgi:hypothetical protein
MTLSGNPKVLAWDIAKGILLLTTVQLKQYTEADLKALMVSLGIVQREIRAEHVAPEDVPAIKEKNQRLQRINQVLAMIGHYAKKSRLHI